MALSNYSAPFVPPAAPAPFLSPQHAYGGMHQAAAINSLLFDSTRLSQTRQASLPSSPSRRQPMSPRKVKDNRDPYRNQYPQKITYQTVKSQGNTRKSSTDDYDEYYNEPDYEGGKNEKPLDTSYQVESGDQYDYYDDNSSSNIKTKRKLPVVQQPQQQQQPQPTQQPHQPPQQQSQEWPSHPPTYKRIANTFNSAPEPGAKTSLHAVLDFDDDFEDYSYEDDDIEPLPPSLQRSPKPHVTPIEGPILIKNGSVPVVPLYSYPTVNNGSLVQIPILWTALSLALGLEIRGEIIRGVPCIKRFHQLFCPTAGNSYPIERIERFIDDNKALMKRMYGEFQMSTEYGPPAREVFENRRRNVKRQATEDNPGSGPGPGPDSGGKSDSYFARHRNSRQSFRSGQNDNGRVDACESKIEIVTPYWASNSAGKIRAIVNTQHFEQAIHQEVCSKVQTKRCVGDCGCEQKYKWHRLLAYDPDNDCKGIFMDWFLFPSCCVCRCAPPFGN